ncbi:MAG: pyruvate kinase [Lachnospiraceae bacterium]|nr:pyruvate kinase [Lachnospiraceae bacterium]
MEFYGTLGGACQSEKILEEMFRTGMTGVRINMSHQNLEECREWLECVRRAAGKCDIKPDLLIDLQGPELRIGKLKKPMILQAEKKIILGKGGIKIPKKVMPYLEKGQEILLDDGKLLLKVKKAKESWAECIVLRGGVLLSKKSMALPGVDIQMPTLTKSDMENIARAQELGVTGVMLPFVRNAQDVCNLRQALQEVGAGNIRIFSKIENQAGIENLKEIIPESDMIVIARGDLGNAVSLWALPRLQKNIGIACQEAGKPFMVVTQLLHSMEESMVPTRAEVSDIYNSVLDGAQALMLTGETAVGKYPSAAMGYLVQTAKEAMRDRKNEATER